MLFKAELAQKVRDGSKTQTRRPRLENHIVDLHPVTKDVWTVRLVMRDGRTRIKWEVGRVYAVQNKRGGAAIGRIDMVKIRQEDARKICQADVIAEGFEHRVQFLKVWAKFYDKVGYQLLVAGHQDLSTRPDELYACWALTFDYLGAV